MRTIALFLLTTVCFFTTKAQTFTLKSTDLGGQFTNEFTSNTFGCSGANKSPQFEWKNPPAGTQSFALTIYDPQAPTGSGWWHWIIFDIPAAVHELKQGAGNISSGVAPAGSIQSNTDSGIPGYNGPCPPEKDVAHGYVITIYALKIDKLGLNNKVSPALAGFIFNKNVLAKASLIVYCKR